MTQPQLRLANTEGDDARLPADERIRLGRETLRHEARAVDKLAERLDRSFAEAAALLADCRASVVVTGMGKAGLVGQKISATLASTGTRSIFLHPAEAVHGDLGRVNAGDVVLALSQSGETEEVVRLLPSFRELGVPLVAITARTASTLGRSATLVIPLGTLDEACHLRLAPTTSTTAMMAVGDALAVVASRMRGFADRDFARVHPAGALGRRLAKVDDCMRSLACCRVAAASKTVRDVFAELRRPGRRTGAVMLVDHEGRLCGLFTDSDLARLFEERRDEAFDLPIRQVMTARPHAVRAGTAMMGAIELLVSAKISELPVVDERGAPVGMLDVTDVVGLEAAAATASAAAVPA